MTEDEFKRWFGGSAVVTAEGKPQMVFHGTGADFKYFDNGRGAIYFTHCPQIASEHAEYTTDTYTRGLGDPAPNVIAAYLSIRKPLVLDEAWARENLDWEGERDWTVLDNVAFDAEADGYDGLILRGIVDFAGVEGGQRITKPSDQFIVFKPSQIMSALSNSVMCRKYKPAPTAPARKSRLRP